MARTITQITAVYQGITPTLYALCDDATVWMKQAGEEWSAVEPIPQDAILDVQPIGVSEPGVHPASEPEPEPASYAVPKAKKKEAVY
jgi:hypothetical protein